jgi:hypothetical protein
MVLYLCVQAKSASEGSPVVGCDRDVLARTDDVREVDGVALASCEAERVSILTGFEAERDDPHPHQVAPVDPLEALGNHSLDAL